MIAEKFDYYRKVWKECSHPEAMPRFFLTRHVHVAETDEQARAEAEPSLVMDRVGPDDLIARTRVGYGPGGRNASVAGTPERQELRRVFQERSQSYDFWIDNGLALVGSPDTVIQKIEEQHQLFGHDVFCTQHRFGHMAPELAKRSIKLFAEHVVPAFA